MDTDWTLSREKVVSGRSPSSRENSEIVYSKEKRKTTARCSSVGVDEATEYGSTVDGGISADTETVVYI